MVVTFKSGEVIEASEVHGYDVAGVDIYGNQIEFAMILGHGPLASGDFVVVARSGVEMDQVNYAHPRDLCIEYAQ